MTLQDFLVFLQQATGIGIAIGFIMSLVVDWWPGYEKLEAKFKRLLFGGLCFSIPLAAVGVGVALGDYPAEFDTVFWPAIVAGFAAFGTGTFTHTRKL